MRQGPTSGSWIYMPEDLELHLFSEGMEDRAVLEQLKASGLIPPHLACVQPADRDAGGADYAASQAIAHLRSRMRALLLRDMDGNAPDDIRPWFERKLGDAELHRRRIQGSCSDRVHAWEVGGPNGPTRTAVVAVGLPGDRTLSEEYKLTRFAMDDYVLLLAREESLYEQVVKGDRPSHDVVMRKLGRIVELMRSNGVAIDTSKRLLDLFRGITGFRAAQSTLTGRLVVHAVQDKGRDWASSLFSPLIGDITVACSFLARGRASG